MTAEWKLVPVEPTPEMLAEMEAQWALGSSVDMAKREWRAAIEAAPAAPAAIADQTAVQRLRDAAKAVCDWADAVQWALGNEAGVPAKQLDALRAALAEVKP